MSLVLKVSKKNGRTCNQREIGLKEFYLFKMVAITGCWQANGNDNISSEGKIMTQEGDGKFV